MNEITKSTRKDAVTGFCTMCRPEKKHFGCLPEVGIPRSTYYAFLEENPDVLAEFQAAVKAAVGCGWPSFSQTIRKF